MTRRAAGTGGTRNRCVALALGLWLGADAAAAQTVGGVILEQGSDTPVVGALVSVWQVGSASHSSAATDSAGRFLVRLGSQSGNYAIQVTHPSYLALQDTLRLRSDEAVNLKLQLGRDAIPLDALVVTARMGRRLRGYYDRLNGNTGFGRFLTRAQLDNIPANRTSDYLRRAPGLRLDYGVGGAFVVIDNARGTCTPLIYIDGVAIEQRDADLVDEFLQPSMLEGIEIYAGTVGMPLEFAAAQQSGCGVVAFWTQDPKNNSVTWTKALISAAAVAVLFFTGFKIML